MSRVPKAQYQYLGECVLVLRHTQICAKIPVQKRRPDEICTVAWSQQVVAHPMIALFMIAAVIVIVVACIAIAAAAAAAAASFSSTMFAAFGVW